MLSDGVKTEKKKKSSRGGETTFSSPAFETVNKFFCLGERRGFSWKFTFTCIVN